MRYPCSIPNHTAVGRAFLTKTFLLAYGFCITHPLFTKHWIAYVPATLVSEAPTIQTKKYQANPQCTILIRSVKGNITVQGHNEPAIEITTEQRAYKDGAQSKLMIDESQLPNQLIITVSQPNEDEPIQSTQCSLKVPHDASLELHTDKGNITTINMRSLQTLETQRGTIEITLSKVDVNSTIYANTTKGDIILISPKIDASLLATASHGVITCEWPLTIKPLTTTLDSHYWKDVKESAQGNLGKGGMQITLTTNKGNIKIKRAPKEKSSSTNKSWWPWRNNSKNN